jgi:hypothetical protein
MDALADEPQHGRPARGMGQPARLRRPGERYRLEPMTASVDVSDRFVLPAGAPLLANLAALWAVDHELAAAVEALHGQQSYPVEESKSGDLTVAVNAAGGRRLYLHSRYRPREEAARLIEAVDFEKELFFHVHGLGLGYAVELLFESAGHEASFCVFEPDLLLLRTALEKRDLSRLIESRRVLFFTKLDKGDLFAHG